MLGAKLCLRCCGGGRQTGSRVQRDIGFPYSSYHQYFQAHCPSWVTCAFRAQNANIPYFKKVAHLRCRLLNSLPTAPQFYDTISRVGSLPDCSLRSGTGMIMQVPQEMDSSDLGLIQERLMSLQGGPALIQQQQTSVEGVSGHIQEQQQPVEDGSGFVQEQGDALEGITGLMQRQQEPLEGYPGPLLALAEDTWTMQEQGDPMVISRKIMKEEIGLLLEGADTAKGCPEPINKDSRSLMEVSEPKQEQSLGSLDVTVCPMDVVYLPLEGQACRGWSTEESVLGVVALSQDTARNEVESSLMEPTASTMLPDTDASEELENEANAKKQKKKQRYKKRKRKKRSEASDSADPGWLAELPFVNADIETIFGTSSESNKPPKKKRKQRDLNEKKDDLKEKQARPNYFISLPITNPKIVGDIEMIQDVVVKKDERFSKAMVPKGTLHITLFVMHLANEEDLGRAINALSESKVVVEDILQGKLLVLVFEGVADFRNEVVYAKLVGEDSAEIKLNAIRESMESMFKEKDIQVKESKAFTPHLTFMKLSRSPKMRKQGLKKVDLKLYEDFKSHSFGKDTLTSLDLCSMQKKRQPSGYYHCDSSITFGPDPQRTLGTTQYISTRTDESEDMIHSPSVPEQHIKKLPSTNSSISAGKSAVFGSTPITSFSDHTRMKRRRRQISKAARRELTALRFKLNQIKKLLTNPETRAKMYKEVCGAGTGSSHAEHHGGS